MQCFKNSNRHIEELCTITRNLKSTLAPEKELLVYLIFKINYHSFTTSSFGVSVVYGGFFVWLVLFLI